MCVSAWTTHHIVASRHITLSQLCLALLPVSTTHLLSSIHSVGADQKVGLAISGEWRLEHRPQNTLEMNTDLEVGRLRASPIARGQLKIPCTDTRPAWYSSNIQYLFPQSGIDIYSQCQHTARWLLRSPLRRSNRWSTRSRLDPSRSTPYRLLRRPKILWRPCTKSSRGSLRVSRTSASGVDSRLYAA